MLAAVCCFVAVGSFLQVWLLQQQILHASFVYPRESYLLSMAIIDSNMEILGPEPTGECGKFKCFFRVNSGLGYLLAQDRTSETNWTQSMVMAGNWQFGNYLETRFHQKHLMLGPPIERNISAKVATRLNSNLLRVSYNYEPFTSRYVAGTLSIQPVQSAPKGSVLWGCNKRKRRTGPQRFQTLLATVNDKEAFLLRIRQQLASLMKALRAEPCLLSDFQVIITPSGDIYWIDLDACAHSPKRLPTNQEAVQSCLQMVRNLGNG